MKKILLTALFTALMSSTAMAAQMPTVDVNLDLVSSNGACPSELTFNLSDGEKTYTEKVSVDSQISNVDIVFDVDDYEVGKEFYLSCDEGLENIRYYEDTYSKNDKITLNTYTEVVDDSPIYVNSFSLSGVLSDYKPVYFFHDFVPVDLSLSARYINGEIYIPAIEVSNAVGISDVSYDETLNEIKTNIYNKQIKMYPNDKTAVVYGDIVTLENAPLLIDGVPFVALEEYSSIVGGELLLQYEEDHINAIVTTSTVLKKQAENYQKAKYVNSKGLSSDTEYLIWVDKSDFMLRVYKGSKGDWEQVDQARCAIGTPATPTCVGTYKYYSRHDRWQYSGFYVGPIMRFNGGYCIHSTFIRNDGTDYDNRVGMMLSHGCIRLQPADINRVISYIPLYTTVHITN